MLTLTVLAIGKAKPGPERELVMRYSDRCAVLARSLGCTAPQLHQWDTPKAQTPAARQEKEGAFLRDHIPPDADIWVLDEHGTAHSTAALAKCVAHNRDSGRKAMAFLIGGADGHAPNIQKLVAERKARALSFGPATWPHMLVRAMLYEQLYRVMTLLADHPYHRI